MRTKRLLWRFLAGLLLLSRSWAPNSGQPVYIKVGDTAHLSPDSVTNPIISITWKHGRDMAMEWFNGNTDAYRQFKDRGFLNNSTGVMTIRGTTLYDSGSYTSEINGKFAGVTQLLVVSPVSKPTVSTQCNEDMTCVFTCEGHTTDAEPITYEWMSEEPIGTSTNKHSITKEEKTPWFSCALHNPVSNESSDQVPNPFNDNDRKRIGIILGASSGLFLILCLCAFAIYIRRRGNQGHWTVEGNQGHWTVERRNVGEAVEMVHYTANQHPASVTNGETSPLLPNGTATPNQEQPVDDEAADPQVNIQIPDQHLTPAVSQDTNNSTENLTTVAVVHEVTPNQEQPVDDQAADPQVNNQTSDQHLTPAVPQDTNVTANQGPEFVVSPEISKKSEVSLSGDQETPNKDQLVDDQAAEPEAEELPT